MKNPTSGLGLSSLNTWSACVGSLCLVTDPDLQIMGGFHPDPETKGGLKKIFFPVLRDSVWYKSKGGRVGPLDPPLVLIMTVHDSEWPDARKRGRNNSPRGDAAHVSQLKRSFTDNRRDRRHHHYHSTAAACGHGRPGLNWLIQTSKVWQIVLSWNRILTQILLLLPMWGPHTRLKKLPYRFVTLPKIHFSTKHRHVTLPAPILSPPRFAQVEFDRTLISYVFLMSVHAPFLLLLLCVSLLCLKRDAKWFIGNIWQHVS